MPATSFIADAQPVTHTALVAGFVVTLLSVLPVSEGASQDDLSAAAAAFIDCLAVALAAMPGAETADARRRLTRRVARELESTMANLLCDPERVANLRIILREGLQ